MSETKRPVVFDVNCPFDVEIEYGGVLVVGDQNRATHEAVCVNVGSHGQLLSVTTKPIAPATICPECGVLLSGSYIAYEGRSLRPDEEVHWRTCSMRKAAKPIDPEPPLVDFAKLKKDRNSRPFKFSAVSVVSCGICHGRHTVGDGEPPLLAQCMGWGFDVPAKPVHFTPPLRSEPERMEVKYEGDPPPWVPAPVGAPRSSSEWANEFMGTWLPAQRPDGNPTRLRYLKPPLPADFPDLSGVPRPDFDWDAEMQAARARGQRNKARGILKHGPFGSGEAGPCDPDCAKCKQEATKAQPSIAVLGKQLEKECALQSFVAIQRENTAVLKQMKHERETASAEWSAQLRAKVAEAKRRDAEAARYTPYWSPEEQSGGDL